MIQLTFLGSGNAFNHLGLGHQSILLRYVNDNEKICDVLLDCGPTAIQSLIKEGKNPNTVQAVFLTHFHGDHAGGLPFLFLHRKYMPQARDSVLHVIGGKGLQHRVMLYLEASYPTLKDWIKEESSVTFHEITDVTTRQQLPFLDLSFEVIPIPHEIESLGYRVHVNEKIISLTGDTKPTSTLSRLADEATVFITECSTMKPIPADHVSWEWIKVQLPKWTASWIVFNHYAEDVWNARNHLMASDRRIILAQDGLKLVLK